MDDSDQAKDLEIVLRFLSRGDVQTLFSRAAHEPLTSGKLADMPLPAGLSLKQSQRLLLAVNRLYAIRSKLPDRDGHIYWYTTPHEVSRLLQIIDRHCTEGSQLDRAISEREGKRFVVRSLIEEAIATSGLDGADIDYEDAYELLKMDRTPVNDGQRVIVNAHRVLSELPRLVQKEITPELLLDLYTRVTEGTENREFDGAEIVTGTHSVFPRESLDDSPVLTMTRMQVLEKLCEMANDPERACSEHPAGTALIVQWNVNYWQPFPGHNGSVARLLFKLLSLKNHYPVLGFLPLSSTVAAWHEGRVGTSIRADGVMHVRAEPHGEVDMTAYLLVHLQLIRAALGKLKRDIAKIQNRNEQLRSLLQLDPTLNGRQRSILGRALRVPGAKFRIRYHQTTHQVAYSTARADLMELVAKGYLRMMQEGKAFIFTAADDLAERIGGHVRPSEERRAG